MKRDNFVYALIGRDRLIMFKSSMFNNRKIKHFISFYFPDLIPDPLKINEHPLEEELDVYYTRECPLQFVNKVNSIKDINNWYSRPYAAIQI